MQDHPQLQRKSEMEMGYMRPTKKISMCVHIYVCMHIYIYIHICGIYVGEINITDIRDIYFMDYIDDW